MKKNIAVVRGDYSSPEVIEQTIRVLDAIAEKYGHEFNYIEACIGGAAVDKFGEPLPQTEFDKCIVSDAILFGSIGGPKWSELPEDKRPETGIRKMFNGMRLFANITPTRLWRQISMMSPLKETLVGKGLDFTIIRDLTGGIYFGKHETIHLESNLEYAYDIMQYDSQEIERLCKKAFEISNRRKKKLCLVGKPIDLDTSKLWQSSLYKVGQEFPEVITKEMTVDDCVSEMCKNPGQFDVIVSENMLGEILDSEAGAITGSLGMLPRCCVNENYFGIYGISLGSSPEQAGKNTVNPLAGVLSAGLMLRYALGMTKEADDVDHAVDRVLDRGYRTTDIMSDGFMLVGTRGMGDALVAEITGESEAKTFEALKEVEKMMSEKPAKKEPETEAKSEEKNNAETPAEENKEENSGAQ